MAEPFKAMHNKTFPDDFADRARGWRPLSDLSAGPRRPDNSKLALFVNERELASEWGTLLGREAEA